MMKSPASNPLPFPPPSISRTVRSFAPRVRAAVRRDEKRQVAANPQGAINLAKVRAERQEERRRKLAEHRRRQQQPQIAAHLNRIQMAYTDWEVDENGVLSRMIYQAGTRPDEVYV